MPEALISRSRSRLKRGFSESERASFWGKAECKDRTAPDDARDASNNGAGVLIGSLPQKTLGEGKNGAVWGKVQT